MSTADWYARKLRGEPVQKQEPLPPTPVRIPMVQPTPPSTPLTNPVVNPIQRQQSMSGCPNCGSANYGSPAKNIPPRCFDCGEGLPIQNSTQGMAAPGGETTAAVQVPSAGYNPQQIVGKVG